MNALRQVTGRVAVLDRADIDTDQIIPKQFLKRIERSGYGEFLFFDWMKDPAFELNRPEYRGAAILVTGRNFGCGSSREHAAWALEDAGFRIVLAPSYADIFWSNATKSGLAPIALAEDDLARIKGAVALDNDLTVDLEALEITHPSGLRIAFELDPFARHMLVNGLDDVALTLQREDRIAAYEAASPARFDTDRCWYNGARRAAGRGGSRPRRRRRRRAAPATRAPRRARDLVQLAGDRAAVGERAAGDDGRGGAGLLAGGDQPAGDLAEVREPHEDDERPGRRGELGEVEVLARGRVAGDERDLGRDAAVGDRDARGRRHGRQRRDARHDLERDRRRPAAPPPPRCRGRR